MIPEYDGRAEAQSWMLAESLVSDKMDPNDCLFPLFLLNLSTAARRQQHFKHINAQKTKKKSCIHYIITDKRDKTVTFNSAFFFCSAGLRSTSHCDCLTLHRINKSFSHARVMVVRLISSHWSMQHADIPFNRNKTPRTLRDR